MGRPPAQRRTARAGLYLLGPVRGHALLPVGARQFVAGDLRGLGGFGRETSTSGITRSTPPFHPGLRQPASPLAGVRDGVSATAGDVPDPGGPPPRPEEEIPL